MSAHGEMSLRRVYSRLLIDDSERPKTSDPIIGYAKEPLVGLVDACVPLKDLVHDLSKYVSISLDCTPQVPADRLTRDESAAICLYTMEWPEEHKSFYSILNKTLRTADRKNLRPWFKYLKLLLTALVKIPCTSTQIVWRGVRKQSTSEFPKGAQIIWWSFSSTTKSLSVLESDLFLGKIGERTLFSIETLNGRNIHAHSYYDSEEEILLLPGTYMEVQSQLNPAHALDIVHLKQKIPENTLLEPPFEGACLYPQNKSSKRRWYKKKTFFISIILLTIICITGITVGVVLGSRSTIKMSGNSTVRWCPMNTSNICNFSTSYTMVAEGYYGTELLHIDCNQALANVTAVIAVQKTAGATYAKQYRLFGEGVFNQSHYETNTQIFYMWTSNKGYIFDPNDEPYYVEAQFQLQGTNQTVTNDTYSFAAEIVCNHQIITKTGHFLSNF